MTDIVCRLRRHLFRTPWQDAQEAAGEIERLRAALDTAAKALEGTAEWVESEGNHGTAQGIENDAKKARAALEEGKP